MESAHLAPVTISQTKQNHQNKRNRRIRHNTESSPPQFLPTMPQNLRALALLLLLTSSLVSSHRANSLDTAATTNICIVGSGIAGSSLAHFIKHYTCNNDNDNNSPDHPSCIDDIRIFERNGIPGGRMATVTIGSDTFEAGGSILHPKNLHALRFSSMLNLTHKPKSESDSDSWFGIWDGSRFVFKTLQPPASSSSFFWKTIYSLLNDFLLFWRYGFSLIRMNGFVEVRFF